MKINYDIIQQRENNKTASKKRQPKKRLKVRVCVSLREALCACVGVVKILKNCQIPNKQSQPERIKE